MTFHEDQNISSLCFGCDNVVQKTPGKTTIVIRLGDYKHIIRRDKRNLDSGWSCYSCKVEWWRKYVNKYAAIEIPVIHV